MSSTDRLSEITSKLRSLVLELSGINVDDDKATFTELGFDSLFLTQASQTIQLALRRQSHLPPNARRPVIRRRISRSISKRRCPPTPRSRHPSPPRPPRQPTARSKNCSRTTCRLMQSMLGERSQPHAPDGRSVVTWPAHLNRSTVANTRFGPYKPIEKGEQGGLTETQQNALEALITRYTAKTPGSKSYTAGTPSAFRRSARGFRIQVTVEGNGLSDRFRPQQGRPHLGHR